MSGLPDDACGRLLTERTPAAELGREVCVGEGACHTGDGSRVNGGGKADTLLEVERGGDRAEEGESGPELLVIRCECEYKSSHSES